VPVPVSQLEFEAAMAKLAADLRLPRRPSRALRVVPTSWGPKVEERLSHHYEEWCQKSGRPRDCLQLKDDNPLMDAKDRRRLALSLSMASVWEGAAHAVAPLADPAQLEVLVVTSIATYMVLLVAPEPVSKAVALTMTVLLVGYLGIDTVWNLMSAWQRLTEETEASATFSEVREAAERFGKVLGANAARVLVLIATLAIGNTAAHMVTRGPQVLPRFAHAAGNAERQLGFAPSSAAEARALALAEGRMQVALPPHAVAKSAHGTKGSPTPKDGAHWHHLATNKNRLATWQGGPWTPRFERLFARAGMKLSDAANKVRVTGHRGPHPAEYHQEIFRRLTRATSRCRNVGSCREALTSELKEIAHELSTPGTYLNKLVTRAP
jgi:hypothetical protein